jgi:NDP-hexose 4,6-dehydratase
MAYCPESQRELDLAGLSAVTGADGFIGSHLVEALVASGERVRALVLYNSHGTRGWLDAIERSVLDDVEIVAGDVRDPALMRAFLNGVETLYHLAALIAIPFSYQAPSSYVATNVGGTLNILEAARDLGLRRVVHTSTSEVYGSALRVPIDESHPLQAQSPYAATKIAADKLAESFHLSFGLPVVTLRPFNTFGPRQSARAVIPTILTQVASGADEIRLGSVSPTRDFTYVADTVAAFQAVANAPDDVVGHVLNAGTGREVSIGELAVTIGQLCGQDISVVAEEQRKRPEGSEVERLVCDSSELRRRTGWEPRYDLRDGLQATIDWFGRRESLGRYAPDEYQV